MRKGATSDTRILDVFISTTAGDLSAYRDAVHDALNDTGLFFCTSQKNMVAHDAQAEAFCRDKAKAADIFVGLVGMRRGWEPDGDNRKRSITEIEHDVAKDSGRRRYIWVTPENFLIPANLHEARPLLTRQGAFRKRAMASGERIVSQKGFDSPKDLAAAIVTHLLKEVVSGDLIKLLRPELGQQTITSTEEQKPAVAAALGQLADDNDVNLLELAKNPKGVDVAELEAKLTARAERHAATGQQQNKLSAEYWRHIGALAFLHSTQKALAAYKTATTLDPQESDGWNNLGQLQFRIGDIPAAGASFDSVIAIGRRLGDPRTEAQGHLWKGWVFQTQGELAKAEAAATDALRLADLAEWKAGTAIAYGNLGEIYTTRGDLGKAEEMQRKEIALTEELGRKAGMARAYSNLGITHRRRGELAKAEEMQRKALTLNEELGNKEGIARAYGNLGVLHQQRGELDKAQEMQRESLGLHQALGNKEGMAATFGNLGIIHEMRGELDEAEEMQHKALTLCEELGSKDSIARIYINLGVIHQARNDFDKAEELLRKALTLNEGLGRKEGIALAYGNLGNVYSDKSDKTRMCDCWRKARDIWRDMGLNDRALQIEALMIRNVCADI